MTLQAATWAQNPVLMSIHTHSSRHSELRRSAEVRDWAQNPVLMSIHIHTVAGKQSYIVQQ